MSDAVIARVCTTLLLLVGTFVVGILPCIIIKWLAKKKPDKFISADNKVVSFLTYFGGGVLFATCFLHLLPEAREALAPACPDHDHDHEDHGDRPNTTFAPEKRHGGDGHGDEFPLTEILICAGFIAVYLIEELTHKFFHGHGHSHGGAENRVEIENARPHAASVMGYDYKKRFSVAIIESGSITESQEMKTTASSNGEAPPNQRERSLSVAYGRRGTLVEAPFSFKALITVIALSFHSVFEGMAIGIQDSPTGIWKTFFAICVHKFVIAFVVGLEVFVEGARVVLVLIYMGVFSAMSPLGILISTAIASQPNVGQADGILNALATGTLFYVTFFEVLQKEDKPKLSGLVQLCAVLIGFGFMAAVNLGIKD